MGDVFEGGNMSDFFESIFGSQKSGKNANYGGFGRKPIKGDDYTAYVEITLEEAFKGVSREFQVNNEKIAINLKSGIKDGHTQKITGKGLDGQNGGINGDLIIKVKVEEHKKFERKDNDLHLNAKIDLYTVILGGEAQIKTIGGKLKINISAETQIGKKLKLKGQGMPIYNNKDGKRGDLYVIIDIKLPKKLIDEERELFTKLKELRSKN